MELKQLLEAKVKQYNRVEFIEYDPISIPHKFSNKTDIEIAGYLTSIISWGRRPAILKSANKLMEIMGFEPYNFIMNAGKKELISLETFVYRTFNYDDCLFALEGLKGLYSNFKSMEDCAYEHYIKEGSIKDSIVGIRNEILKTTHLKRSEKHFANPGSGSAAKRTNMFLRWMIRKDNNGVDFGIWESIPASALMIPLDVHSGNTARKLGLLSRKQNDWKSVEELTNRLKEFDPIDPVKYDFALFGIGVFDNKVISKDQNVT
ncbi:MAG: TIGR02757 family protein [Marinilabiliales bacterium]|nr:MAG: TIGR02757 family protein [Marinilabiliales bacterium]